MAIGNDDGVDVVREGLGWLIDDQSKKQNTRNNYDSTNKDPKKTFVLQVADGTTFKTTTTEDDEEEEDVDDNMDGWDVNMEEEEKLECATEDDSHDAVTEEKNKKKKIIKDEDDDETISIGTRRQTQHSIKENKEKDDVSSSLPQDVAGDPQAHA